VITKPEAHDINTAGERLLREALEPLGWVVNAVEKDYGIDYNIQLFKGKFPTGTWLHVQLKSSASSEYSADQSFVSQEITVDHARHYALEMREPVLVIHADVESKSVYWYAPQLDRQLATVLVSTNAKFTTFRVPTRQKLPDTAQELLRSVEKIHLVLATRELTSAPVQSFAENLSHFPDQEKLHRDFQERNDLLKLHRISKMYKERKYDEARPRAEAIIADRDSTVETKFWAQTQLEGIDFSETVQSGKPQNELPKVALKHAKALRKLTASGPKYLKFYSLIARHAAELEILVQENYSLHLALQQHTQNAGLPMMALRLYAERVELTQLIVSKYNRCVRLTRYATNYPDRWMLGRAILRIVKAIAPYLITLSADGNVDSEKAFARSALQICKASAWICEETGDGEGVVLAILDALMTTNSEDSDAYRWAMQVTNALVDPELRADALRLIDRAKRRWKGEVVDGDYQGDPIWQIIQNMATGLGIDISDENSPLVRGLKIAARDDSPERVLKNCEHLLVSLGAMGPIARRIVSAFNISTAGSKVVHCTLHNFHVEGKEQDVAYADFKRTYCDSCPDRKPRPDDWQYIGEVRTQIEAEHRDFVARLAGTAYGIRRTNQD
jgi:Domain of unknown function (DUF4365)